jgi:hypothetical protein
LVLKLPLKTGTADVVSNRRTSGPDRPPENITQDSTETLPIFGRQRCGGTKRMKPGLK